GYRAKLPGLSIVSQSGGSDQDAFVWASGTGNLPWASGWASSRPEARCIGHGLADADLAAQTAIVRLRDTELKRTDRRGRDRRSAAARDGKWWAFCRSGEKTAPHRKAYHRICLDYRPKTPGPADDALL